MSVRKAIKESIGLRKCEDKSSLRSEYKRLRRQLEDHVDRTEDEMLRDVDRDKEENRKLQAAAKILRTAMEAFEKLI